MNDQMTPQEQADIPPVLAVDAKARLLARRHMLLKGLGKGGAVLAATIPLKTLASTSVFTYKKSLNDVQIRCGISGMQSGVHSQDTVSNVCMGYSPGRYKKRENWPTNLSPDVDCISLFSRCAATMPVFEEQKDCTKIPGHFTGNDGKGKWIPEEETCTTKLVQVGIRPATLLEVLNNFENTDEFHWITAWINGNGGAPVDWQFPYTGDQVIGFYNGGDAANALTFFKTYMESHT